MGDDISASAQLTSHLDDEIDPSCSAGTKRSRNNREWIELSGAATCKSTRGWGPILRKLAEALDPRVAARASELLELVLWRSRAHMYLDMPFKRHRNSS